MVVLCHGKNRILQSRSVINSSKKVFVSIQVIERLGGQLADAVSASIWLCGRVRID